MRPIALIATYSKSEQNPYFPIEFGGIVLETEPKNCVTIEGTAILRTRCSLELWNIPMFYTWQIASCRLITGLCSLSLSIALAIYTLFLICDRAKQKIKTINSVVQTKRGNSSPVHSMRVEHKPNNLISKLWAMTLRSFDHINIHLWACFAIQYVIVLHQLWLENKWIWQLMLNMLHPD